jgi:hypothetical protein
MAKELEEPEQESSTIIQTETNTVETHIDGTPPSQLVDRYKNRRKMAWISFYCICIGGTILISLGLFSDVLSTRLNSISFMIGTVFGVWGGIVLAYFGASAYTDTRGMR